MRVLMVLVALCVACSPAPASPSPDASVTTGPDAGVDAGPPGASDYCELTAQAYCAFYVRCGRMAVASEAECMDVFLESCNGRYERVYSALAQAGLMALRGDGMAACHWLKTRRLAAKET